MEQRHLSESAISSEPLLSIPARANRSEVNSTRLESIAQFEHAFNLQLSNPWDFAGRIIDSRRSRRGYALWGDRHLREVIDSTDKPLSEITPVELKYMVSLTSRARMPLSQIVQTNRFLGSLVRKTPALAVLAQDIGGQNYIEQATLYEAIVGYLRFEERPMQATDFVTSTILSQSLPQISQIIAAYDPSFRWASPNESLGHWLGDLQIELKGRFATTDTISVVKDSSVRNQVGYTLSVNGRVEATVCAKTRIDARELVRKSAFAHYQGRQVEPESETPTWTPLSLIEEPEAVFQIS